MAQPSNFTRSVTFWILVVLAAAVIIFLIGKFLFPEMIRQIVVFIGGLLAVVTGLFLRRRRN